jgi:hypothetical protein
LDLYKVLLEKIYSAISETEFDIVFALDDRDHPFQIPGQFKKHRVSVIYQEGEDLGKRMFNVLKEVFAMGYDRCAITGSDIPGITPAIIHDSLFQLDMHDYIISPSADGGYCILSLRRDSLDSIIFQDIAWSSSKVMEKTIDRIKFAGKDYALLPALNDIDTLTDIQEYYRMNVDKAGDILIDFLNKNIEVFK